MGPEASLEPRNKGWSDPFVGRQFARFQEFLEERHEALQEGENPVDVAEHLCEWSRNLLNRTFGRTTKEELCRISELFAQAAALIRRWKDPLPESGREQCEVFASHIERRTKNL